MKSTNSTMKESVPFGLLLIAGFACVMMSAFFLVKLIKRHHDDKKRAREPSGSVADPSEVYISEVGEEAYVQNMWILFDWDWFDAFTFYLVGEDIAAKAKPEYRIRIEIAFRVLCILGFLIPVIAWGLRSSLRRYVTVEMVYDALQFLVVQYFWDIDGGFLMREGEEMSRWVLMLSQATSAVDFFLIKGPSACYAP